MEKSGRQEQSQRTVASSGKLARFANYATLGRAKQNDDWEERNIRGT